ncbi:solute carrier family 2, facilitated glucose transporter member 9-like, partial [Ictalurus furcatus]|uniref:solute carrier family 2, facilitated glucose transporter member 9-like n=1 Tax=Ictalurus furcatus TaxID=66913 RepID=UPI00234FE7D6
IEKDVDLERFDSFQVQGKVLLFIIILGLGGSFQVGCHLTLISSPSPFIRRFINSSWTLRYGEAPGEDTLTLIWGAVVTSYAIGGLIGAVSVGFVISHVGSEILGREEFWDILLCVPAFFSFIHIVTLPFFPDAPRYLLIEKGELEECKKALQSLWGPGDYKPEIEEMQVEMDALKGQRNKSLLELLRDSHVRWQCLSLVTIYTAIQFCGISAISVYAFSIFEEAGIPVDKIRYVTLGIGASEILTSVMCSLVIDRVGRRVLLWAGFGIMAAIMVLLTVTVQLKDYDFWIPYSTVGLVFLFVIFYGGGPAAVNTPLSYEMFVQSDRSAAFTLMAVLVWGGFIVFSFVFPFLQGALMSFSFLIFACVGLAASLYIFFLLPETKGKTPLEIVDDFRKIRVCGSPTEDKYMETKL